MLDFNTKKEILRKLQKKGAKNIFMRVLCGIAAIFVKIWYGIVCRIGMIFTDKHGNLFGIKGLGERKRSRKQDDVIYVKKPFFGRVLSAVLAFSFVMMFVPELDFLDGLMIRAKAVTEEVDGVEKDFSPWDTDPSYYYVTEEYNYVLNTVVTNNGNKLTDVSDSAFVVYWDQFVPDYQSSWGDDVAFVALSVRVYQQPGGSLVYSDNNYPKDSTSFEATQAKCGISSEGTYTVEVSPVFTIRRYHYVNQTDDQGNVITGPDDQPLRKMAKVLGSNSTFTIVAAPTDAARVYSQKNIKPDASINKPEIDPPENDVPKLSWTASEVSGEGLKEGISKAADGYIVYGREEGGNYAVMQAGTITNGALSYNIQNYKKGTHYQFFVESYKVLYSLTNNKGYNTANNGMVTSSGLALRTASANDKAGVYDVVDWYTSPAAPTTFVASSNGKDTITLTWRHNSEGGRTGYYIYRSEENLNNQTGEYIRSHAQELAVLGSNETSFADTDATKISNKDYYYYIFAYLRTNDDPLFSDFATRSANLRATVAQPQSFIATPDDGRVTLTWARVAGADGYKIYIRRYITDAEGKIVKDPVTGEDMYTDLEPVTLYSGNTTSYEHIGLLNGDIYSYKIKAFINVASDNEEDPYKTFSIFSDTRTVTVGLDIGVPQDVTLTTRDGEITVSWGSVKGATGYRFYLTKLDANGNAVGKAEEYDNIEGLSRRITGLKNGDVYSVQVNAYKIINGKREDGKLSSPVSIKVGVEMTAPQDVTTSTIDGQITITWSPVASAQGYRLYYINPNDGKTYNIDVTNPRYVHAGLNNGDIYEYWVVAYKTVSGFEETSPASVHVKQKVGIELAVPQNLKVTTKDGETTVTWTAVPGAEGYILEYRRLPNQNWDFDISTGKGSDSRSHDLSKVTSFNHTRLNNGDMYEYRVRAYKTVNGERVYSDTSVTVSTTVGSVLNAPKDFTVTTTDGVANLSWSRVTGAEGYIIYAYSSGISYQYDVSATKYTHSSLINGDRWTYYVVAYKTVNGVRVYSDPTQSVTVTVGVSMAAPVDLTATASNRQVDLKWTAVTGAQGYVVYLYNEDTMEYDPIAVTSKPNYSHLGLKNGNSYTYMVAAFKTINGTRIYGEYSMPVTAIPTTGSTTDIDRELTIKGTAPYGISHGEYISAGANHGAFDESVDVYFTTSADATNAVRDVLKGYANGLSSFIIYPFDISIYKENTLIKVDPNRGYSVTITMPIPDRLIAYRDYITVIHINEDADMEYITNTEWLDYTDRRLEVLPCAVLDIDNVWCIQFECTSFSPYAIVIYKDHLSDVSAGGGIMDGSFAGSFNSGVLLFTTLPDILPNNKKLKVVSEGKKRYRIKSIEKRNV